MKTKGLTVMTRPKIGIFSKQGTYLYDKRPTSPVFELIRVFISSISEDMIKTEGAMVMTSIFPYLVVAIATKGFIQFPSKAYVINPSSETCYRWEMIEISLQAAEI